MSFCIAYVVFASCARRFISLLSFFFLCFFAPYARALLFCVCVSGLPIEHVVRQTQNPVGAAEGHSRAQKKQRQNATIGPSRARTVRGRRIGRRLWCAKEPESAGPGRAGRPLASQSSFCVSRRRVAQVQRGKKAGAVDLKLATKREARARHALRSWQ
nr:hypothetical protein [Pandoravirus aubagnensis]